MNKKIITIALTLTLLFPITANAALKNQTVNTPTIAVLDTALDSSLPIFQGKIANEVCIIDWASCPNGQKFMEGPGAAALPSNLISKNGFEHGTQMASIVVQNNPNANIVFIRIIGATANGTRQTAYESTVYNALNWVYANKDKWNIQAVTMSQGNHSLGAQGTNYCPNTPKTKDAIIKLISVGVPSFFSTGNTRDYKRIDWPSCIDESISVASVDNTGYVARYANYDVDKVDFVTLGDTTAYSAGNIQKNVSGTSASTALAAAQWVQLKTAKPSLSYQDQYRLLSKTSSPVFNSVIKNAKLIDIEAAING